MKQNINARDVLALIGVGLLTAGSAWIYLPLGFLVPGALFVGLAVVWRAR